MRVSCLVVNISPIVISLKTLVCGLMVDHRVVGLSKYRGSC